MAAITVPVTDEGIVIPSAAVQLLGGHPGDWAEIEIRVLPSPDEIADKALYHILHHLGDAVYVDNPTWTGEVWRVPLKVKGLDGTFGQLVMTSEGEVIEAESTSRMELREAIRLTTPPASRAAVPRP